MYDKYSAQMYSVCLRYGKSQDDANDIFQQAFFLVYKNIHQLKNPKALSGWVKTIFVNAALAHNKKNSQYAQYDDIDIAVNHESENWNKAFSDLATSELTDYIQELPAGSRNVFNLYVIEGYSHKEIAEMLGISVGTSKSQLFDARKFLKKRITEASVILGQNK